MTVGGEAYQPTLVADACVLISAEKGRILTGLGMLGLCTTDIVLGELHGKSTFGFDASSTLAGARIQVVAAEFGLDSIRSLALPSSLSEADISCLMLAREHNAAVLTEDLDLIQTCKSKDIAVRRTDWWLSLALDRGYLSCAEVDKAFSRWRDDPRESNLSNRPELRAIESRCRAAR